jgi:hypothetical protein
MNSISIESKHTTCNVSLANNQMNQLTSLLCALCVLCGSSVAAEAGQQPNFIVILADDLGYGDLGCYGATDVRTPHIDHMAEEGTKFTSFYVSPVCSPTRASLMTGSIAQRVGIGGVLFPRNNHGLNPDEQTLPELLKQQGYATAIAGKDGAKSPHEAIYYLRGRGVSGIRMDDWKYLIAPAKEILPAGCNRADAGRTEAAAQAAQCDPQGADESGAGKTRRHRDALQFARGSRGGEEHDRSAHRYRSPLEEPNENV